jgi:hypothetical protein
MPYLGENTPETSVLWLCSYLDLHVSIGHLGAQQDAKEPESTINVNSNLIFEADFFILNG